jgi:Zn-dependent peptidase ImmA (M78 family)
LFDASERQARLLRELLAATADPLLSRLTDLIPTLCIDTLDAMPVGGTSFWGNGRWHIHLRQGDPTDFHRFTALHQLKHIIDYPLRQKMTMVKDADWEAVADYFATSVLRPPKKAGEYIEYTTREEDAYEPNR